MISDISIQEKLGVQSLEYEEHSIANKTLLDGAAALGFQSKSVPQNIRGDFGDHAKCGSSCTYGCRGLTGKDKSPGKNSGEYALLNPILRDSGKTGGPVIKGFHGFEVDKVLFDDKNDATRATGVIGYVRKGGKSLSLTIRAGLVIVSAGALNTPVILQRSGLKVSRSLSSDFHSPEVLEQAHWPTLPRTPGDDSSFDLAGSGEPVGRLDFDFAYQRFL